MSSKRSMSILLSVWAGSSFTGPVEVFGGAHHAAAANNSRKQLTMLDCWPRGDNRLRRGPPEEVTFPARPLPLNILASPVCNYNLVHSPRCHQADTRCFGDGLRFPSGPEPRSTFKNRLPCCSMSDRIHPCFPQFRGAGAIPEHAVACAIASRFPTALPLRLAGRFQQD